MGEKEFKGSNHLEELNEFTNMVFDSVGLSRCTLLDKMDPVTDATYWLFERWARELNHKYRMEVLKVRKKFHIKIRNHSRKKIRRNKR